MILRANGWNIELPNPQKGNTEELELNITNNFTMDGSIYSYASPLGEIYQTYSWKAVDITKAREFENFIKQLNNEEVFIDFKTERWRGRILSPSIDITHESRVGCAFSIQFVGVKYA